MADLYDARGNLYVIATPAKVAGAGVPLPSSAEAAARTVREWAGHAIDAFCRHGGEHGQPFVSHGLLIGPFGSGPPFELLIVNTDGSLAERSGNGLTIFVAWLRDRGLAPSGGFDLFVRHGSGAALATSVRLGERGGDPGVWLSMGEPMFGPEAVGARPDASQPAKLDGVVCSHVPALAAIEPLWRSSLFVRVGNPHCVSFLKAAARLPSFEALQAPDLRARIGAIANAGGPVCPAGVNLQWAAVTGPDRIAARVFERGEGPTPSSGTSATAVAAAALQLHLVTGPELVVDMPGGSAPVVGRRQDGRLVMSLFGQASKAAG
jgi:diaminopimelate epimerase